MIISAYDLKMLINKDSHDILKPNWLHECISREELVAMRPRYSVFQLLNYPTHPFMIQTLLPRHGGSQG
jgi:hypothetical protein